MMELITITEAAKMLGVANQTLRNWESCGQIKCYRTPGGHRRYNKEEVMKFYESANY